MTIVRRMSGPLACASSRSATDEVDVAVGRAVQQPHREGQLAAGVRSTRLPPPVLDQPPGDRIGRVGVVRRHLDPPSAASRAARRGVHPGPHRVLGEVRRGGDADEPGDPPRQPPREQQGDPAAHARADQHLRALGQPHDRVLGVARPAADRAGEEVAATRRRARCSRTAGTPGPRARAQASRKLALVPVMSERKPPRNTTPGPGPPCGGRRCGGRRRGRGTRVPSPGGRSNARAGHATLDSASARGLGASLLETRACRRRRTRQESDMSELASPLREVADHAPRRRGPAAFPPASPAPRSPPASPSRWKRPRSRSSSTAGSPTCRCRSTGTPASRSSPPGTSAGARADPPRLRPHHGPRGAGALARTSR